MARKLRIVRPEGADYEVRILGDRVTPLRDFYHALLRMNWPTTLLAIAAGFLLANALFALCYQAAGGIAHARPDSFADAFYFSVQTMGTIGYGAMYPETDAANVLVVAESIVSLTLTALATGLVFAKFSRPSARVLFSQHAVVRLLNGTPTLMVRVGNQRGNRIVDVQFRATLTRTERLSEGESFFRAHDIHFTRPRALSLSRSWSVMHVIDAHSPLHGSTPESLAAQEAELNVMVVGLDDTSMQALHASHTYYSREIVWGVRLADILTELDDGSIILDLNKFHDTEAMTPTATFPYPQGS